MFGIMAGLDQKVCCETALVVGSGMSMAGRRCVALAQGGGGGGGESSVQASSVVAHSHLRKKVEEASRKRKKKKRRKKCSRNLGMATLVVVCGSGMFPTGLLFSVLLFQEIAAALAVGIGSGMCMAGFAGFAPRTVFFPLSFSPRSRHLGRYGREGQLSVACAWLVLLVMVLSRCGLSSWTRLSVAFLCNDRFNGPDSADVRVRVLEQG